MSAQLLVVDGESDWVVSALARRGETAADYRGERIRELLAAVVGLPAADPVIASATVRDVRMWDLALRVSETFRHGRILRAGDAAHEILPTAAMGLNLAIADADALAWRLIAVLRGWGAAELLAGYDRERRAVAVRTAEWSRGNLNAIAGIIGAAARDDIAAVRTAVPALAGYLDHPGLDTGPLLLPEANDPRTLIDDGRPGSRAQHLSLEDAGRSSLDLYDAQPVLLVDRTSGIAAASGRRARELTGVPLTVVGFGDVATTDAARTWWSRHGVSRGGAVLVGPDGYVCWRAPAADEGSSADIAGALRLVAGWDPVSAPSAASTVRSSPGSRDRSRISQSPSSTTALTTVSASDTPQARVKEPS
jgi:hypothetical protein